MKPSECNHEWSTKYSVRFYADGIEWFCIQCHETLPWPEAKRMVNEYATLKLERDIAMSENQRLTKHVEDYEEENAHLVERSNRAMTRAIQAEAKLAAIECAGCGKTMLECGCDD